MNLLPILLSSTSSASSGGPSAVFVIGYVLIICFIIAIISSLFIAIFFGIKHLIAWYFEQKHKYDPPNNYNNPNNYR